MQVSRAGGEKDGAQQGEGGQAGTARDPALVPRGARRTLTGVLGQPGSDADLQHFVTGLEDGQVTEALVELHLPRAPGTPGTPVLFFQLDFKPATSMFVGVNKSEWSSTGSQTCCRKEVRPGNLTQPRALRSVKPQVWHDGKGSPVARGRSIWGPEQ